MSSTITILLYALARVSGLVLVLPTPFPRTLPMQWRVALIAFLMALLGPTLVDRTSWRELWAIAGVVPATTPRDAASLPAAPPRAGRGARPLGDELRGPGAAATADRSGSLLPRGVGKLRADRLAGEFAIGVSLAAIPCLLMLGLRLALDVVDRMVGLASLEFEVAAESVTSPPGLGTPLSGLVHLFAGCSFLLTGGHRRLIHGLLETFVWLPGGQHRPAAEIGSLLAELLAQSWRFGCQAVLPLVVCLLMATIAAGLLSRTIPALNQTSVNAGLGLATYTMAVWLLLGVLGWAMAARVEALLNLVLDAWRPTLQ